MIKHVYTALKRNKTRNLFITLIMLVIMSMSCIALSIHTTSNKIRDEQKSKYGSQAYIDLSEESLKALSGSNGEAFSLEFPTIPNDVLLKLAKSEILKDTILETSFSARSDTLELPKQENGQGFSSSTTTVIGGKTVDESEVANLQVAGYGKEQETSFFTNRNKKLNDGAYPSAINECIISNKLAELNNLKVNDKIKITSSHYDKNLPTPTEMEVTITGIYQTLPTTNNQTRMFLAQDEIYMLNDTVLMDTYHNEAYVNATYYLHSPNDLEAFQKEATALGLPKEFEVKTDAANYESVIAPINGIAQVAFIFLWIVLALGGSLLILLTIFNIRERNYEIGILRALGMKRKNIITQMILEPLCLASLALCLGYGIGMFSAQPISDHLLQQQLDKGSETIFQGTGSILISNLNETPIEDMQVNFDIEVFLQMCAIAAFLIFLSGGLSALYIVKYEPMQILSERR